MVMKDIDFAEIKDLLEPEEIMVQDMAKKFTKKEIVPKIKECFEKDRFPRGLVYRLASAGFLGIKTDPKYTGNEFSGNNMMYGLVCYEIEKGDSGIRSFLSVTNSLVMYPIEKFGSEEQKQKWLPLLASGKRIGCFGLTDPDSGSNPAEMKAFAQKKGNKYILNGSKQWITNADIADVAIVWAKTEKNDDTGKSIRGFIVEKKYYGKPGFTSIEEKGKWSMCASDTGSLFFQDLAVDEKDMLPGTKGGLKTAFMCLNEARYGIAWGAVGMASWCLDRTNEYLQKRTQRGKKLAGKQIIQIKLARMAKLITTGQLLAWRCGAIMDENKKSGKPQPKDLISIAKDYNTYAALQITRICRELLGANGISLDYHIIRHMNNAETLITYEGTRYIHELSIGRALTGLSAF